MREVETRLVYVRELDQIPMASCLGYLIRDGTTGSTEKDQLLGTQMNHVEKSFETHSGIALPREAKRRWK